MLKSTERRNKTMIYADNAATTKLSETALKAMTPYLTDVFYNPSSLYSASQKAKELRTWVPYSP